MSTSLYPKSPQLDDNSLTALTSSYMFRVVLAIISIILFFVLYAAMVVGLAYLVKWAFLYNMMEVNKLTIFLKIGAIAGSIMLFVFTLKFIFKLKNHKPNNRIKLESKANPELWNFVNQICKETGAPKPSSIYVDPDVNAYVSYTNSWLSLFLPVKKDLTLGLGLVSCLNLSEFKAVVAHEFGHFAQSSMRVGSYIMSANTIIHDMIFSRDSWDNALDNWKSMDLRLSAAAWVITPIIWVIRQLLNLFYQFLNIMYSSLSREMEFNADKVAVSTTGSDAIISALWKLDEGAEKWHSTLNFANVAAMKNVMTDNLYHHNQSALDNNYNNVAAQIEALPADDRGGKRFFSTSHLSKVNMYASHPPNDMRQDNAKVPYINCATDERSPWLLFGEKEKLQSETTSLVYKEYFNKSINENASIQSLQQFIASETVGSEILEKYDNTFADRFIEIPENLFNLSDYQKFNISEIDLKNELAALMAPVREIEGLMQDAHNIATGATKQLFFRFQDNTYDAKNLEQGYNLLLSERQKMLDTQFKSWDKKLIGNLFHKLKSDTDKSELINLLKQHQSIVEFYKLVIATKSVILSGLNELQEKNDVQQIDINAYRNDLIQEMKKLNDHLQSFDGLKFVPMANIDNVTELKSSIIDGGKYILPYGDIFENGGFDKAINQLDVSIQNCQRIDQKSIITILSFND